MLEREKLLTGHTELPLYCRTISITFCLGQRFLTSSPGFFTTRPREAFFLGGGGGGGEGGSRNGGMVIGSALEHKSFPRKPFYDLSFTVCAINAWRVSFLKRHLGAPYKSVDYRSSFCQT